MIEKEDLLKNIKSSWLPFFDDINFDSILNILNTEKDIFPKPKNIFKTLKYFDISELKVVILGQDCYIRKEYDKPQATGLAFSVPKTHKIPPSLRNIYKELNETIDNFTIPAHGNISRWTKKEKILLLNSALTVKEGKSNSHMKLWEPITDKLIKFISDNCENVVFILWGNFAKSKKIFIDNEKHYIIEGVHPSPLSARPNSKGQDNSFFGHDYFNKVNLYLKKNNINEINWLL